MFDFSTPDATSVSMFWIALITISAAVIGGIIYDKRGRK